MISRKVKGWIAVLLIFSCGLSIGAGSTLAITQRRLATILKAGQMDTRNWLLDTMHRKLSLSEEQLSKITGYYEEAATARRVARIKTRPVNNEAAYVFVDRVEAVLTRQQKKELEKMIRTSVSANRHVLIVAALNELALNKVQRTQFDRILAETATLEDVLKQDPDLMVVELFFHGKSQIRQILDEDQQAVFDSFLERVARDYKFRREASPGL